MRFYVVIDETLGFFRYSVQTRKDDAHRLKRKVNKSYGDGQAMVVKINVPTKRAELLKWLNEGARKMMPDNCVPIAFPQEGIVTINKFTKFTPPEVKDA